MSFRNAVIEELANMWIEAKDYDVEATIMSMARRLNIEKEVEKRLK